MGVVAAIVPWNFPFPIACWKAAPALAAGNCVVLKPASISPLTALKLGELAHEAGLPPAFCRCFRAAVRHRRCAGHPSAHPQGVVHRFHRDRAADHGTGVARHEAVSLELGGKSPNIVFADADWQRAADTSPMSVFANTGQDCCARSRMFVERSVYEPFVERFVAATRSWWWAIPAKDETQLGPHGQCGQRERWRHSSRTPRVRGTRFRLRRRAPGVQGASFWSPRCCWAWAGDRCWREEIFGPVVAITPFDDEATMLREVNDSPYGLSGSVWTSNLSRALRVARRCRAGCSASTRTAACTWRPPSAGSSRAASAGTWAWRRWRATPNSRTSTSRE
jgi:acyl-CoA reductase-like NAD-dependent aldehyde dehydrogenase